MAELRLSGGYIPIKKLVFDIQKGSFLRTYYVKPEYLTKVKQELVRRSYQYIRTNQLNETFENLKRSNDYSTLATYITDENVLWNLATNFHLQDRITSLNPRHSEYKLLGSIINYILTDNDMYLKGLSTIASRATKTFEVRWNASTKTTTIQEKRDSKHENVEIVKFIPQFIKKEVPQLISKKISSTLSFLRPTELKLSNILEKLIASNFKDDNYILHNLLITPHINYSNNNIIERILRSIIVQKYRIIFGISSDEKAYKYLDTNWFTYNYLLLSEESRNEIMKVYPNSDVTKLMNCTTFDELLRLKLVYQDSFYSFILLSPTFFLKTNINKILKYVDTISDLHEKQELLYLLVSRNDIPYHIIEPLIHKFNLTIDDILSDMELIVYNSVYAKKYNMIYIPFRYLVNEMNPFRSTFIYKLLQYILRSKYKEYEQKLDNNKMYENNITLYYNVPQYVTEYQYMLGDNIPIIQHLDPLVQVTEQAISPINIQFTYSGEIYRIGSNIYIPSSTFIEHVSD